MKHFTVAMVWLFIATHLIATHVSAETATIVQSHGQRAWQIENKKVRLTLTQVGGHMAPVVFDRDEEAPIEPYYVSPWQEEGLELDVPVLVPLRGDFFCMPFSGNAEAFNGESHPPHGETAGSTWTLKSATEKEGVTTLEVVLDTKVRKGKVTKRLSIVEGQNVVYTEHIIEGFSGPTPLGHHATLQMPEEEGAFHIATSPIQFGMTNPTLFSNPVNGEYQSLAINHRFSQLDRVSQIFKDSPHADLTRLPARKGYADLVQIVSLSKSRMGTPAWTTATHQKEQYLWFSLKDPDVLPSTVFWLENHGRHGVPWNGRNNCLGLEEVCAYFADGLVPSVTENALNKSGVRTSVELKADRPTTIRTIQGVARVPASFHAVKFVIFGEDKVTFVSRSGTQVTVPVNHAFLDSGTIN